MPLVLVYSTNFDNNLDVITIRSRCLHVTLSNESSFSSSLLKGRILKINFRFQKVENCQWRVKRVNDINTNFSSRNTDYKMNHVSTLCKRTVGSTYTLMRCHLSLPYKSSTWLMLATIWRHMEWPVLTNIFFPAALFSCVLGLIMHTEAIVLPFLFHHIFFISFQVWLVLSFLYMFVY